jgi:hypothetical protein
MTERDQEHGKSLPLDGFVPADEDFEEPEEGAEAPEDEASDEADAEEIGGAAAVSRTSSRRFGLGRGIGEKEEEHHRPVGSVRGTHERVHVDDRASAIFAVVCAVGLLGLLGFSYIGGILPKPVVPTLSPLLLQTGNFTLTPATASLVTTASPTASPTAAPTASPTASPIPSPSK